MSMPQPVEHRTNPEQFVDACERALALAQGDDQWLAQILTNLLANAEFIADGLLSVRRVVDERREGEVRRYRRLDDGRFGGEGLRMGA